MANIVSIKDTATTFVKMMSKETPRYIDRAIQSSGKYMKKEIQAGIESGAPGGQRYQPFSGLPTKLNRTKKDGSYSYAGKVRRNFKRQPLGRLKQAVRYRMYKDSHRVIIGWINKSAEEIGLAHELGKTVSITPKMRALFFKCGLKLSKGKKSIIVPKRETIGPEYQENAPKIPGYIEGRLWAYIQEGKK